MIYKAAEVILIFLADGMGGQDGTSILGTIRSPRRPKKSHMHVCVPGYTLKGGSGRGFQTSFHPSPPLDRSSEANIQILA